MSFFFSFCFFNLALIPSFQKKMQNIFLITGQISLKNIIKELLRPFKTFRFFSSPKILVIIFWNFAIFQYRSDSPQVKRNLITSIANLVYELPHELPNYLRKLEKIRKTSYLGGHIAQCPVSLQEPRLCQQQLKNVQKYIPNVPLLVQFYWITPFCFKYFVPNCSNVVFSDFLAANDIIVKRTSSKLCIFCSIYFASGMGCY